MAGKRRFDRGDWDAAAHVRLLREGGGAAAGYTADLIEALDSSHAKLYEALERLVAAFPKVDIDQYPDEAAALIGAKRALAAANPEPSDD